MKLSVSNIAWPLEEQNKFLALIKELGCSGVEIAPSIIWPDPIHSSVRERIEYKKLIHNFGLEIPAIHALLYGEKNLGLFRDEKTELRTIKFLKDMCFLASDLGAKILVFGSPQNRRRGTIPLDQAFERAAKFFNKIAPTAKDLGVKLCIEPLCPDETDFISTVEEGIRLVEMINHSGFSLHLDGKAVSAQGKPFVDLIEKAMRYLEHFHINDSGLKEINSTGSIDHASLAHALHEAKYSRYISVEMRKGPNYFDAVRRSIIFTRKTYLERNDN